MLPDPAKPQLQPPRDSVQKFSTIASVATVAVAVATAILIHLLKEKVNNSVETIAPIASEPAMNPVVETIATQSLLEPGNHQLLPRLRGSCALAFTCAPARSSTFTIFG
jgi:hypothetical protein